MAQLSRTYYGQSEALLSRNSSLIRWWGKSLYQHRFELYLIALLASVFSSLFITETKLQEEADLLFFLFCVGTGLLLANQYQWIKKLLTMIFLLSLILQLIALWLEFDIRGTFEAQVQLYLGFFFFVSFLLIHQIWRSSIVDGRVILGVIAGYMSLGLVAFFFFLSIELFQPNSYSGLPNQAVYSAQVVDAIMYYAYVTLLTIGYGEIVPVSQLAQKAAIIVGLAGQLYLVILTAIIVGKYIEQRQSNSDLQGDEQ